MAPRLRAQTALEQGPSIFPSTQSGGSHPPRQSTSPSGLCGLQQLHNIPSYRCMHMNIVEIKYLTKKCTDNG